MIFALDLTPRQAARAIEQALRARVSLAIELRSSSGEVLEGALAGREGHLLLVDLAAPGLSRPLLSLVGVCCDVWLQMQTQRYLFTSAVLDVAEQPGPRLYLSTPEVVQLLNRRRFERTNATVASQVRIWPAGQATATFGLLKNISASGLACTLAGFDLDEVLLLGDCVRVQFELAGFDELFELPAAVCNKSLGRDSQELTVGLEFSVASGDEVSQHTLERLRASLCELMNDSLSSDGEA